MSVGVHSGLFNFFLVGESHREFIVTGPAASAVVEMEGTADAGEIVISAATAAALRPSLVGPAKGPGFLLRRPPSLPEPPFLAFEQVDPRARPAAGHPARAPCRPHHPYRAGAPQGHRGLHPLRRDRPAHRRAGPEEAARQLDVLVTHVQGAVDRQGVTFLATDADKDGGKIILTAGAPSTSGDDEQRMLLAVREIMDADNPLPIRIGVNQGSVFVGEVGPHYRRTFTVMGDAVNLAARLMAKAAPGRDLHHPGPPGPVPDRVRVDGARAVLREGQGQAGAGGASRRQDQGRDRRRR